MSLSSESLPKYSAPPVSEVVCGLTFAPLALTLPHIGLFWHLIKKEFPDCQQVAPVGVNDIIDPSTGLPLPRVWLVDESGTRLIQYQRNRFLYNWRKTQDTDLYPSYDVIIGEFERILVFFNKFLKDADLEQLSSFTECELTYINSIPAGYGSGNLGDIFPDLMWRESDTRFLKQPSRLGWNPSFELPNDAGWLNVRLNSARRKADNAEMWQFQLSASGIGKDRSIAGAWDWFSVAHERIVRGFADLTSAQIQRDLWKSNQ